MYVPCVEVPDFEIPLHRAGEVPTNPVQYVVGGENSKDNEEDKGCEEDESGYHNLEGDDHDQEGVD